MDDVESSSGSDSSDDRTITDDYFSFSTSKNKTSNSTFKIEVLDKKTIEKYLSRDEKDDLQLLKSERFDYHRSQFSRWYSELCAGFNLLFFGFGSKKKLLTSFASEYCAESPCIVVYGYLPHFSIKRVKILFFC